MTRPLEALEACALLGRHLLKYRIFLMCLQYPVYTPISERYGCDRRVRALIRDFGCCRALLLDERQKSR